MAPALRTVSSWSGVSSDSQITSWLWVVQGAPRHGTAPPRGTRPCRIMSCCCIPNRAHASTARTCTHHGPPMGRRALEEPVWALRPGRPPLPSSWGGQEGKGRREVPGICAPCCGHSGFGASWIPAPHLSSGPGTVPGPLPVCPGQSWLRLQPHRGVLPPLWVHCAWSWAAVWAQSSADVIKTAMERSNRFHLLPSGADEFC